MLVNKDGKKIPIEGNAAPLIDKNNNMTGCVVVFRDITKKYEVEQMKDAFISIASHQLRTPLTGIRWVIELFMKNTERFNDKEKEYLRNIHASSERLTLLVDQLLNVSRIEGGGISLVTKKVDAWGLVRDITREFSTISEVKKVDLKFNSLENKIIVETDVNALRNIVQSVISNAIEYTPEKGSVEVCVEEKNDSFIVSVTDTGIGIPKKDIPKLFTKFRRSENARKLKPDGTGLGLYITKQAIDFLGGSISVESEEGKGTKFNISLPIHSKNKKGVKKFL